MPTSNYFADDGPEIILPPYDDEEDYAPPPMLNGGRVWQNPRTAGVITPQELSPIPGSVSPGVMPAAPPGAPQTGIDAGMEDMMQSDVPPGALPAMQRMAGGAGAGPSSGPTMPPGPDYGKLEQIYRDYPQLTKPKWYQRLGGAAAGFGAGWSNAASRTKHPIDIPAMEHNILHPGYDDEVAQWQAHAFPEEKIAGLEGSRQGAWWKNQEMQSRTIRDQAYADYMKGAGRNGMVEVTDAIEKATNGQLKTGDRVPYTLVSHAMDIAGGKYAANQLQPVYSKEIADILGVPVRTPQPVRMIDEAIRQITALNRPTAHHNASPEDVLLNPGDHTPEELRTAQAILDQRHPEKEPGRGTRGQFNSIQARKNSRLLAAENGAKARLAAGKEDASTIYADLNRTKQQIQDSYESEISVAGGEPEHYDYPDATAPRANGPQGAGPAKTTPPPKPPAKRITVKLPDGRFMTGTPDQFKEAGIQLNQ